jgi:hypothetical protein
MTPRPYEGIEVSRRQINSFLDAFTKIYASKVYPEPNVDNLRNHLRTIEFLLNENTFRIELYRKYRDQIGWFLYNTDSKVLYGVTRDVSRLFFQRAQNFWDKSYLKQIPKSLLIQSGDREYPFIYDRIWKINKDGSREVKQNKMNTFIKQLRLPADQIERVSLNWNPDLYKEIFRFTILSKQSVVLESNGDLIVWDKQLQLLYHYWIGQEMPFDTDLRNYFY